MRRIITISIIHWYAATASAAEAPATMDNTGSSDLLGVLLLVILPALVLAVIGRLLYKWWSQRRMRQPHPHVETPEELMVQTTAAASETPQTLEDAALVELRNTRAFYEAGEYQDFAKAIALVVKRYVGEHYQVKIADATTSQILAHLPQSLSDGVVDHVGEILHTCDALEFARHRPSRGELDRLYRSALAFLEQHQVVPLEVEEPLPESEPDEDEDELREIFQRYFPR